MSHLGLRKIVTLKPYPGIPVGSIIEANCWINLDAYIDCAETAGGVGLGRITGGGWKYVDD